MLRIFFCILLASISLAEDYDETLEDGTNYMYYSQNAVSNAAEYLLNVRHQNLSWGSFTPRAAIALSFADIVAPLNKDDKVAMKNQLNVQLALDLKKKLTLSRLGHFINALLATCQNPRNFHGLDLVAMLRSKADTAMKDSNFNLPYVLLTMCIVEESTFNDFKKLVEIYKYAGNKTDVKAIALMAMECMKRDKRFQDYYFDTHMTRFIHDFKNMGRINTDVYTKALILQAKISAGLTPDLSWLLSDQKSDGSFRDPLSTYYAIPALMNTSVIAARLNCRNDLYEGIFLQSPFRLSPNASQVTYSLWIENGNSLRTHSIVISYVGNKTFFDIMKMAWERDFNFRFNYDETDGGKKVYSIANLPEDAELNKYWNLYKAETGRVTINSKRNLNKIEEGVDRIKPENHQHYIFWLQYCPDARNPTY